MPTHRQAHPTADLGADGLTVACQINMSESGQIQEAFVNAVNLLPRAEIGKDAHDPVGHVGIQRVIAGTGDDAVALGQFLQLEPRRTHFHPQRLDLVGAGHATAVVVGQDHHGPSFQRRVEYSLAGDVEVVAVD